MGEMQHSYSRSMVAERKQASNQPPGVKGRRSRRKMDAGKFWLLRGIKQKMLQPKIHYTD